MLPYKINMHPFGVHQSFLHKGWFYAFHLNLRDNNLKTDKPNHVWLSKFEVEIVDEYEPLEEGLDKADSSQTEEPLSAACFPFFQLALGYQSFIVTPGGISRHSKTLVRFSLQQQQEVDCGRRF